jgi:hypothetical protein
LHKIIFKVKYDAAWCTFSTQKKQSPEGKNNFFDEALLVLDIVQQPVKIPVYKISDD